MMLTSVLHRGLVIVAPGRSATDRLGNLIALPRRIRADREHAHALAQEIQPGGERQLVVVGDRPLDPSGDSASHRLGWLLRMALLDGYRISFYSVRARRWYGVESGDIRLTPLEPPVAATVVWVVRPEAGAIAMPALRLLRPRPRVVYDTMDLHHLRLERESAVTGSRGLVLQARLMKELERQAASSADVAIAITSDEAPRLARLAGRAQVVVLPNVHLPGPTSRRRSAAGRGFSSSATTRTRRTWMRSRCSSAR